MIVFNKTEDGVLQVEQIEDLPVDAQNVEVEEVNPEPDLDYEKDFNEFKAIFGGDDYFSLAADKIVKLICEEREEDKEHKKIKEDLRNLAESLR